MAVPSCVNTACPSRLPPFALLEPWYEMRMPVNSTHPDYDANLVAWSRARDVISGEDAVRSAGTRYLPRLDSQTDEECL